jgi:uncharacterized protein (TIGR03435 family)
MPVTHYRFGLPVTAATVCLIALSAAGPAARTAATAYEVVSIRINRNPQSPRRNRFMPDGGFTATGMRVVELVSEAFSGPQFRGTMAGLPKWAFATDIDIVAKVAPGSGPVTAEQRRKLTLGLLVNRFRLVWHEELREQEVYDLLHARSDRRLGPGLTRSTSDCAAAAAQRRAAIEAALAAGTRPPPPVITPPTGPLPPCTLRQIRGGYEGEIPIDALPPVLRGFAGREVIDKTGLTGSYQLAFTAVPAGMSNVTEPGDLPSVFTAVREQLGLKLVATRGKVPAIVIDRLEPPSEN